MTKLERATRKAIRAWCEAQEHPAKKISRVFPRAYIVARLTINCLVAAVPACDTRKLPIGYDFGSHTVHNFDPYLHIGDWWWWSSVREDDSHA